MFMKMQMRQMQQVLGPKVPASNLSNPQKNPTIEPKGQVQLEKEASESENESENSESEEQSSQESSSTKH